MSKRSLDTTTSSTAKKAATAPNYWLMKSEVDVLSIHDLQKKPNMTDEWDGVRNYQARNFLKSMKIGDKAFFYHSNVKKSTGIVGTVTITSEHYPDTTYKPGEGTREPKEPWVSVDVTLNEIFKHPILLDDLKKHTELNNMALFKQSRLSVQPVTSEEYDFILGLRQ